MCDSRDSTHRQWEEVLSLHIQRRIECAYWETRFMFNLCVYWFADSCWHDTRSSVYRCYYNDDKIIWSISKMSSSTFICVYLQGKAIWSQVVFNSIMERMWDWHDLSVWQRNKIDFRQTDGSSSIWAHDGWFIIDCINLVMLEFYLISYKMSAWCCDI